jgi:transcriptional regulator of arginine metabolism
LYIETVKNKTAPLIEKTIFSDYLFVLTRRNFSAKLFIYAIVCKLFAYYLYFMQKGQRQNLLKDLIRANEIGTQEELSVLLDKKGIAATQSSVSRDLVELGIVKVGGIYALPETRGDAHIFGLQSLETAGNNLIVAKCEPGLASAACVKLDAAQIKEIVGTIAGEDTIFIAVKDAKAQKTVMRKVWEIFER